MQYGSAVCEGQFRACKGVSKRGECVSCEGGLSECGRLPLCFGLHVSPGYLCARACLAGWAVGGHGNRSGKQQNQHHLGGAGWRWEHACRHGPMCWKRVLVCSGAAWACILPNLMHWVGCTSSGAPCHQLHRRADWWPVRGERGLLTVVSSASCQHSAQIPQRSQHSQICPTCSPDPRHAHTIHQSSTAE